MGKFDLARVHRTLTTYKFATPAINATGCGEVKIVPCEVGKEFSLR
jgi:hypothetical protein